MVKTITDTDFITYAHLSDDEYQLVYSIFFFYGDFGSYGYNDEYIFNHLVRLCKKQPEGILKSVRVKQWVSLLETIITKLQGVEKTVDIVIPYYLYSYNVEQTIKHYQFVRLVLVELLQEQFQNLTLIKDEGIVEIISIPTIEEVFEEFFESKKTALLPSYIYKFLYNELIRFYIDVDETSTVKCLEYIDALFLKEFSGEEQKAKEFFVGIYNEYKGRILEGNIQTFPEYVRDFFEFYILPFKKYAIEQNERYVDWKAMKENELSKRFYGGKGFDDANKLYQGLFLDCEIPLIEYENEFNCDTSSIEIIDDSFNEDLVVDSKTVIEKKKHGDELKRVGVLYYMLKDNFKGDKTQMAKIISFALGVNIPDNGRMGGSSIYQYVSNPKDRFPKIEDYIKKELNKYKCPIPKELD